MDEVMVTGGFRDAYSSLLDGTPVPFRLSVVLLIALLLVAKVLPRLLRALGGALRTVSSPTMELLLYPEFVVTTLCRRRERPLIPGTFAYGRALGAFAGVGGRIGEGLRASIRKTFRYPWKTVAVLVLAIFTVWFVQPVVPPGPLSSGIRWVNQDQAKIDRWLATGKWSSPTAPKPSPQTPVKAKKPPKSKKAGESTKDKDKKKESKKGSR